MSRHYCRHCSDPIPHDGGSMCYPCSQLPVAERGRQPGADDDRQPTRCVHCGLIGSGKVCPACVDLLSDLGEYDETRRVSTPPPAAETEQARRDRLYAQRVAHVKAEFERGRRCLLARALDPNNQEWARCQPRK